MNKDLTVGRPEEVLWKFCIPLFGSIIFQQLYNIADSLVAGKFIGEQALAAVGNSYEITLIFIAVAFGCNIGCSVTTSQLFGAKRYKDMKVSVSTAMIASAILCGILVLLGLCAGSWLLVRINTPHEIFAQSLLYLKIYVIGLPFLFFYNISTGIFTALGDSKTPFLFLAVSSSANILIDIFFVAGLHMGVAGVAWATFLCQGCSCILALTVVIRRLKEIQTEGRTSRFSVECLKNFAVIAIPSMLQQSFVSIGNIILQGVINTFGTGVVAGYSAAIKLNNLVISSYSTIGNGMSNYTAQNMGAGILSRIKAGFKAGVKMVWILTIPFAVLYLGAGRVMIHFFMTSPSEAAIMTGMQFLRIVVPFYFIISIKLIADGVLRGSGRMKSFMITTFTDLILRVVLAIVLSARFGSVGIWMAWPVGWSISTAMSYMFYRIGPWKNEK